MHLHLERKMSKYMLMNHPWAHQHLHSIIVFKTPNSTKLFNRVKQNIKLNTFVSVYHGFVVVNGIISFLHRKSGKHLLHKTIARIAVA